MLEDKAIAPWQTYTEEACKDSESLTGGNKFWELSDIGDIPNWDSHFLKTMHLQYLADADDFKTQKKVQVISAIK